MLRKNIVARRPGPRRHFSSDFLRRANRFDEQPDSIGPAETIGRLDVDSSQFFD
jgi:hypothetical protein